MTRSITHPLVAAPTTLDSMKRLARSLPVEQQVDLIRFIADGGDFASFDDRDTIALDRALANMADCAAADRVAEDRALHGPEVHDPLTAMALAMRPAPLRRYEDFFRVAAGGGL